jgi:hypothetical protein
MSTKLRKGNRLGITQPLKGMADVWDGKAKKK